MLLRRSSSASATLYTVSGRPGPRMRCTSVAAAITGRDHRSRSIKRPRAGLSSRQPTGRAASLRKPRAGSLRGRDRVVRQLVRPAQRVPDELRHLSVGELLAAWRPRQLDAERGAAGELLEEEDRPVPELRPVAGEIGLRAASADRLVQVEQDAVPEARQLDIEAPPAMRAEPGHRSDGEQDPARNIDGVERVVPEAFWIRLPLERVGIAAVLFVG